MATKNVTLSKRWMLRSILRENESILRMKQMVLRLQEKINVASSFCNIAEKYEALMKTKMRLYPVVLMTAAMLISCAEKKDDFFTSKAKKTSGDSQTQTTEDDVQMNLDSENVPEAVKMAALSVLKMRSLSESPAEEYLRTVDVSTEQKVVSVKSDIMKLSSEGYDELDKAIIVGQVDDCLKKEQKDLEKCSINFLVEKSNAFIVQDSKTVVSTLTSLEGFIKTRLDSQSVEGLQDLLDKKISTKRSLYDGSNNVVLDGDKNTLVLKDIAESVLKADSDNRVAADSNYAFLTADKDVGTALKLSGSADIQNEQLYVLGYGAGSKDILIEKVQIVSDESEVNKVLAELGLAGSEKVIVFSNVGKNRLQGGVIVTEKGEVVAVDGGALKGTENRLGVKLFK